MTGLRRYPLRARALAGALLAILLALRLLSPDGFMPSFEQGAVTIVACPDFDGGPAPMAHHGGSRIKAHCPYAASVGAATAPLLPLPGTLLLFGFALFVSRTYRFLERQRVRIRPPARGPPLPA
jgi:hypothetical protein